MDRPWLVLVTLYSTLGNKMSDSLQASLSHQSCSCVSRGNLSHSFSNTSTELLLVFTACLELQWQVCNLERNIKMDIQEQMSVLTFGGFICLVLVQRSQ